MKKLFFVIIALFILTGCEANYNLTIEDNGVIESCDFLIKKTDDNERTLDDYYNTKYLSYYDIDAGKDYNYEKKRIDDGKYIGMNLSFAYSGANYQKSSMLDRCFYKKSFIKTKDYIILYTEEGASCFYKDETKLLDSLNVNIKTDLNVVENNADSVKGNVYTWKFTKDNFSKKNILIKIKRSGKFNFIPFIVILIILSVFLIIFIRVRNINKKSNKF